MTMLLLDDAERFDEHAHGQGALGGIDRMGAEEKRRRCAVRLLQDLDLRRDTEAALLAAMRASLGRPDVMLDGQPYPWGTCVRELLLARWMRRSTERRLAALEGSRGPAAAGAAAPGARHGLTLPPRTPLPAREIEAELFRTGAGGRAARGRADNDDMRPGAEQRLDVQAKDLP